MCWREGIVTSIKNTKKVFLLFLLFSQMSPGGLSGSNGIGSSFLRITSV